MLLDEYIFDCETRGLSKQTIQSYKKANTFNIKEIKKMYDDNVTLNDLTTIKLKKLFLDYKKGGVQTSTINLRIKTLKLMFDYAVTAEYIDEIDNPLRKIKRFKEQKKLIRTFNDAEVYKMINSFDSLKKQKMNKTINSTTFNIVRDKFIIMLLADTGLRCNELINILNVDINKDQLFVRNGKGGKQRMLYMSATVVNQYFRYIRAKEKCFNDREHDTEHLLINGNGGRQIRKNTVNTIVLKAAKRANVRSEIRASPHTFRHYAAQKLLEYNDTYTVSKILGHSNTKITEIYLRSMDTAQIIKNTRNKSPLTMLKKGRY